MSFTFDNRSCENFGLYVENYPDRPVPEKLYNTYQVPGLSGKIFIPQGSYANVIQPYDVFVKGGTKSMQELIAEIAAWLLTPDEPKDLTDSYDTTALRKAVFVGGNEWANSLNKFGRCTLNFDCSPQRYDRIPSTSSGTITGGSQYGFIIGTGTPKGSGYIDDIIPFCQFWPVAIVGVGEKINIDITNTITGEQTTIVLECTADMSSDYEIIIDMLKGTMYVRKRSQPSKTQDILTYFDVTVTGSLKMRFTYQVQIDVAPQVTDLKYLVDPRWYKL